MTNDDLAYVFKSPDMGGALTDLLGEVVNDYTFGRVNLADARHMARAILANHHVDSFFLSEEWLNLFFDTHSTMAHAKELVEAETPESLDIFPAWRLERYSSKREPRNDWAARWKAAGDACGWDGAARTDMVALKASPIWRELGDGAGGFRDTLGNPYPPFAIGSGMNWSPVREEEAIALGLFPDGNAQGNAALSPGEREIVETLRRLGPDFTKELLAELEED